MTKSAHVKDAQEILAANIVVGDVDDDTAVVNTAGLISDIAAVLTKDSEYFLENEKPHEIGAGDVLAIHGRLPDTVEHAYALGWNECRLYRDKLPIDQALQSLILRLDMCATFLENLETLPKPYDLYYAVKQEQGWSYRCANIGVSDIRAAHTTLTRATGC